MTSLWRVKFLWSAGMSRFFGCMFVTHTQSAGMLNKKLRLFCESLHHFRDLRSTQRWCWHFKASEMWRCWCGRVVSYCVHFHSRAVQYDCLLLKTKTVATVFRVLHLLCIMLVLTKIPLNTLIAICLIFDTTIPSTFCAHSVNHHENTA
jgi:hypothetical protein